MTRRLPALLVGLLLLLQPALARLPNFVVILVDDLGWADLSGYGSRYHRTPNLDRLAAEGVRFTDAYSACTVCSPTRAALLTGRYPARLRVTDWIAGHPRPKAKLLPPDWSLRLPEGTPTIASLLRPAGYATAHVGKWHLGGTNSRPQDFGFDINKGGDHRGQPPRFFSPYGLPELADGPEGEYLTDREADEAIRFIRENRQRPFFLHLAHYAVHQPIAAKDDAVAEAAGRRDPSDSQRNAIYAAMVGHVDEAVGRIRAELAALGIDGDTVIMFTSENGGLVLGGERAPTSNWPLRSGKGDVYEGGTRVPLIVHAPGSSRRGRVDSTPVHTVDILPTLLELAGINRTPDAVLDGVSLLPLLQGRPIQARPLYWHYPHYHPGGATPYGAVRDGDFKLIEFYESGRLELYHLASDPGERVNVANALPERANQLAAQLAAWRQSVGAQMPVPNPAHVPAPIRPGPDGSVVLSAHAATVHGENLRYEPQAHKDTLGYWTRVEDWASWEVALPAGRWEVEVWQGCGTGHGGSEVEAVLGESRAVFTMVETGHLQRFLPRRVARLEVGTAGPTRFALKPRSKPGGAIGDVRQVILRPVP